MLRVLYVIDSLVPGGAERSLVELVPSLRRAGVQLDIVCVHDRPGLQREARAGGATVVAVGRGGRRAATVRALRQMIRDARPDIVHTTLFEADVLGRTAALATGTCLVSSLVNDAYGGVHVHDPNLRRWKVWAAQLADGLSAQTVRRFHAISQWVADGCARRLRIPRERIDVIPRGRDPEYLGTWTVERRDRTRQKLAIATTDVVVLAAARQEYQKGLDRLLDAFSLAAREVPGLRLLIAGRDGGQSLALRRQIEALGIGSAVRLLGVRDDVPDLMCAADVFVLPSRYEGLGGVLLEAMALRAPIVASDLPAVREVVEDGVTAHLVCAQGAQDLASAIVSCVGDRPAAAERAARAQQVFHERYTTERTARDMLGFYERALHGS